MIMLWKLNSAIMHSSSLGKEKSHYDILVTMKITYDKRANALNVSIRPGVVAKTIEVAPEVLLDVDKKGRTLNLEILGAREKIGIRNFGTVSVGNIAVKLKAFA